MYLLASPVELGSLEFVLAAHVVTKHKREKQSILCRILVTCTYALLECYQIMSAYNLQFS